VGVDQVALSVLVRSYAKGGEATFPFVSSVYAKKVHGCIPEGSRHNDSLAPPFYLRTLAYPGIASRMVAGQCLRRPRAAPEPGQRWKGEHWAAYPVRWQL
jgi:hypothetical protein